MTGIQAGRRLLLVHAHPDDETFGCGSLLAHARRMGVRTVVACATRGEAGCEECASVHKVWAAESPRSPGRQCGVESPERAGMTWHRPASHRARVPNIVRLIAPMG